MVSVLVLGVLWCEGVMMVCVLNILVECRMVLILCGLVMWFSVISKGLFGLDSVRLVSLFYVSVLIFSVVF